MNDNNYILLPQVKIGFIYNHIQTVVPFVLDESLDTYNLLRKLVDYCNELGARSNELQYILKDLVDFLNNKLNEQKDYINNFLENLQQEWLEYKQSLEDKYNAFTEQVDTLFEQYKNQIRDEYNQELANIRTNNDTLYNNLKTLLDDKITELTNYANSIEPNIDSYIDEKDQAIKELITNFQNEFTEYQKTVNNELVELGDTLTQLINTNEQNVVNQINTKTTEIINTLNNVNMEELVSEKLNSYSEEELADLFKNLYGSIIRITYWDTNEPPIVSATTPIYHYNPTTHILTDCTTGQVVELLENSLYLYENYVYIYKSGESISIQKIKDTQQIDSFWTTIDGYPFYQRNTNKIRYVDIYDNDFNIIKTIQAPSNFNVFVHSNFVISYKGSVYYINDENGLIASIDLTTLKPDNNYTYEGYGLLYIDENNFYGLNFIRPEMDGETMQPIFPDFEQQQQTLYVTKLQLQGNEIVKVGESHFMEFREYFDLYNMIRSINMINGFKCADGYFLTSTTPSYLIEESTNGLSFTGETFSIYTTSLSPYPIIKDNFINYISPYITTIESNRRTNVLNRPNVEGCSVGSNLVYMGRFLSYTNTTSSYDIEKIPYYDLKYNQLIYIPNPYKGQNYRVKVLSDKYLQVRQPNTGAYSLVGLYTYTYTSGELQEIGYVRSGS